MKFQDYLQYTIPELLKILKISRIAFFLIIAISATIVALNIILQSDSAPDLSDSGTKAILSIAGFFCYVLIWVFVKKITKNSDSKD